MLVDYRTSDDAGVYRWPGGPALVQTVDFFTPIVDDPFLYGQIAAANALSDIYAMGGRPLTALAIAAFPGDGLDDRLMRDVFRGGLEKLRDAGVSLLGGHTVRDNEIKFGYAVTGAIDPERVLTNAGARPGDILFLTKAIGTGVVATAIKFDRAPAASIEAAVSSMTALNADAAAALCSLPGSVHACPDVTGFGLAGHAAEMAAASGVSVVISARDVPLLAGVRALVAANRAGGLNTNAEYFQVQAASGIPEDLVWLLHDPQTSGGLLASVAPEAADRLADAFRSRHVQATRVGVVEAFSGRPVIVE